MDEKKLVKENIGLEDAVNEYGSIVWNCKGQSMKPLIRERVDYVVIEKPDREIRPFDVVLYSRDTYKTGGGGVQRDYVLHRVIKREGDEFIILGDNCVNLERVPKSSIIGIMTGLKRNGKDFDLDGTWCRLYNNIWVKPYRIRKGITRLEFAAKRAGLKAFKGIKRIGRKSTDD
ncbi:MAG: S24/S26 family peptidase [Mogibacterium sp.]|nr:S24/S26 family peptidase [Mogibacterium sp.]